MTPYVWISNLIRNHDLGWLDYKLFVEGKIDSRLIIQYRHILSDEEGQKVEDVYKINSNNYNELIDMFSEKKTLAPEYVPTRFYKMPEWPLICNRSIFMGVSQFIFINNKAAQVLQRYNLGNTAVIKLDAYDAISGDRIESDCTLYLLNIAETNEYCNFEKSKSIRWFKPFKNGESFPKESLNIIDDGFVINSAILDTGLDLWADSRLSRSFFISNRLKNALDEAEISQDWLLSRCVVEG